MSRRPQILVTNDDGIDSLGLHALACAVAEHGDVTVVAPDQEFSGSSSAIGSIFDIKPEAHRRLIPDLPGSNNVWAVNGPPALCVLFARMGAFPVQPDIIVSGINPGANVGRSVYHSGTIGACLTGRNGGVPGIAVSQALQKYITTGQSWDEAIAAIDWTTAATIAAAATKPLLESPMPEPGVLNLNIPDKPLGEIDSMMWTTVAVHPPEETTAAQLIPIAGHTNSYEVKINWGTKWTGEPGSDVAAVADGLLSATWVGHLRGMTDVTSPIDFSHLGIDSPVS
ncbi:MAG: 5'/3'-nucleotidase SurE [Acidimicrobiales bacterium]|nr:5'/3'-nucleotidase SurE [Acidimicrobiales bacterium]